MSWKSARLWKVDRHIDRGTMLSVKFRYQMYTVMDVVHWPTFGLSLDVLNSVSNNKRARELRFPFLDLKLITLVNTMSCEKFRWLVQ